VRWPFRAVKKKDTTNGGMTSSAPNVWCDRFVP
jgi:hypothetical protein